MDLTVLGIFTDAGAGTKFRFPISKEKITLYNTLIFANVTH